MQKELNHKVRKCFNEGIYNVARYTEIVLSIIILIVIALAGIRLIFTITEIPIMDMDIDFFTTFLANGLSLVVGVEFVKMLCRHSAQTVVEVLMFATARQMVVEHMKPSQTLIGVIAPISSSFPMIQVSDCQKPTLYLSKASRSWQRMARSSLRGVVVQ